MNKILVANRGEIAVRVIRACKELAIPAVAVYSEADRKSLHVLLADEAVCIGPPAPLESYLNIDAILGAARDTGCDAVHPGYGFLAENDRFAARLEEEGLIFIGPPSEVIRSMGSKIESRTIMQKAGVPIVPGDLEGSEDVAKIVAAAKRIDGPIFLKASAGGGGKGMRLVKDRSNLESLVREAVGEAKSAFGNGSFICSSASVRFNGGIRKCSRKPRRPHSMTIFAIRWEKLPYRRHARQDTATRERSNSCSISRATFTFWK
jgi:acetyl-CoA carboxylase biotin carboxylase subunit